MSPNIKLSLIFVPCVGAILASQLKQTSEISVKTSLEDNGSNFKQDWRMWKSLYNKEYRNLSEETEKYRIWLSNLQFVNRHNLKANLGKKSFTTSLNKYADLSIDDVRKRMNGYRRHLKSGWMAKTAKEFSKPKGLALPTDLDWSKRGVVTGVKDQGQCGSCWSFSATGALEGQHYFSTGNLVSLSEQNLLDCSWDYGNQGCNGGLPTLAFQYVKHNGGVDTEASYPYEAIDGVCRFSNDSIGATARGYVILPRADEHTLMYAVAMAGPISVAVDSSHISFQLYKEGVYDEPECSRVNLDHAMLLVGYGVEDNKDYWLVKNSWGTSWGEQGYIKMSRNMQNQCGIATDASYPLV